jgi:hypothetical protein
MDPIPRTELQSQATLFADEMVAFLEEQNAQSQNSNAPFYSPQENHGWFERLYMRFVATRRQIQL